MNSTEIFENGVDFGDMPAPFFLLGLLNEFNNRFQAAGDSFFAEASWKQCFLLNCITFFKEPPTIKQLAELVGCSHQNTKQLLGKLEKNGFVSLEPDETDRRKQRVRLTEKAVMFREKYNQFSLDLVSALFSGVTEQELNTTIGTITKLDARLKEITEGKK